MGSLLDVDDPRITSQFVREVTDWPGSLTLVGVVHDHPASVHRVRHVVQTTAPDLVALELPPLSISTYKGYARDDQVPPTTGGEMSAAIQSASTDEILGIDGPSMRYFGELVRTLLTETRDTVPVRKSLATFGLVTKSVIGSRLPTGHLPPAKGTSVDYEVGPADSPTAQAQNERRQIRKSRALLDSVHQNSTKTALQVQNSARERHMVDTLQRYCNDRRSVAIVGFHHLAELTTQLERQNPAAGKPTAGGADGDSTDR